MKQNVLDLSTDILKSRIQSAYNVIREQYKGTNPYRQSPVSARETLYNFSQIPPEVLQQARATMGDDAVDMYLAKIQKLEGRLRK